MSCRYARRELLHSGLGKRVEQARTPNPVTLLLAGDQAVDLKACEVVPD